MSEEGHPTKNKSHHGFLNFSIPLGIGGLARETDIFIRTRIYTVEQD